MLILGTAIGANSSFSRRGIGGAFVLGFVGLSLGELAAPWCQFDFAASLLAKRSNPDSSRNPGLLRSQ
ncbi:MULTISPECIES: hypothetical protein [unclassified Bradyrhizobium]|uniref:hypothetical protein n=1 Tax=unclassified Bradyrhizobium TaxID=2631580 RepID=UPI0029164BE9|nr:MULTISPECIES: hypothetical protein [unclassified Bradyrhizobium]